MEHELAPDERPQEILDEWIEYLQSSLVAVEVAKREIEYWQEIVNGG